MKKKFEVQNWEINVTILGEFEGNCENVFTHTIAVNSGKESIRNIKISR
jgi:hypothetical protein